VNAAIAISAAAPIGRRSCDSASWRASRAARRSRADPGEEYEHERERDRVAVNTTARRPRRRFPSPLRDQREEGAPEDHEAETDEGRLLVEQEGRLTRRAGSRASAPSGEHVTTAGRRGKIEPRPSPRLSPNERHTERRRAERVGSSSARRERTKGTSQRSPASEAPRTSEAFQSSASPASPGSSSECRKAVLISHGISAAFSTAYHQDPPVRRPNRGRGRTSARRAGCRSPGTSHEASAKRRGDTRSSLRRTRLHDQRSDGKAKRDREERVPRVEHRGMGSACSSCAAAGPGRRHPTGRGSS